MRRVYLDNAATTHCSSEVISEMIPTFNTLYGNANSLHSFGREASAIVDRARDRVSKALISMGLEELKDIMKDESTEVCCQFCDKKYVFTSADIGTLIDQSSKK